MGPFLHPLHVRHCSQGTRGQPGAFHLGDLAIYGNSWGRAPEAWDVCSLFAAQSPPGLVPRPGRGCVPRQDMGQLCGLEGRQVWARGGAMARALGHFPASSWRRRKTPQ